MVAGTVYLLVTGAVTQAGDDRPADRLGRDAPPGGARQPHTGR
jgi:hypothetical protein